MDFKADGIIQSALLLDAGVTHGVSTKKFGNMSFDRGEAKQVKENMTRFLKVLSLDLSKISLVKLPVNNTSNIAVIKQTEDKGILKLKQDSEFLKAKHEFCIKPGFDAAISHAPHTFLGILPADCAAVMIFDSKSETCAIIHAGKEGVEAGIIFKSLIMFQKWVKVNPEKLLCYIGPNICPKCYKPDNKSFDLAKEIKYQLKLVCVQEKNIAISKFCTCHDHEHFYSHYRATNKETEGRQIAIIGRK